jgi:hypothetical protein
MATDCSRSMPQEEVVWREDAEAVLQELAALELVRLFLIDVSTPCLA